MTPLCFYDYDRQNYRALLGPRGEGEFMIGDYDDDDGSCEGGEFAIVLHDFTHGRTLSPQIKVFDDAYPALMETIRLGLLGALERTEIRHRDDLTRLLIGLGLKDVSDKPLPDPEGADLTR